MGHYLGGATGLEIGSTAPPGFYGTYLGHVNPVDELKGPCAFGTGGEWKYINLKGQMTVDFRYEQEYGVEARTPGKVIFVTCARNK